ncbi:hypothetical protein BKA56DRAFT_697985 [Ilyonectria sp. MPI-CAGE-AT-0026]|nr:hypothetical protein BKA56DRAFT_697985 [Ilyonectria sp. MPI-CAGE-AT-0026]
MGAAFQPTTYPKPLQTAVRVSYSANHIVVALSPDRSPVNVAPVSFAFTNSFGIDAIEGYDATLLQSRESRTPISASMLCKPHSLIGCCYTPLVGVVRLREKYKVQLIREALDGLSVQDNTVDTKSSPVPLVSCLFINPADIISTSRLHVIWGISTDLGPNGLRLGAIVSQNNTNTHAPLVPVAIYSSSSSAGDVAPADMLEDTAWFENYLAENQRLPSGNYLLVTNWLRNTISRMLQVPMAPSWVNFRRVYQKEAHLPWSLNRSSKRKTPRVRYPILLMFLLIQKKKVNYPSLKTKKDIEF